MNFLTGTGNVESAGWRSSRYAGAGATSCKLRGCLHRTHALSLHLILQRDDSRVCEIPALPSKNAQPCQTNFSAQAPRNRADDQGQPLAISFLRLGSEESSHARQRAEAAILANSWQGRGWAIALRDPECFRIPIKRLLYNVAAVQLSIRELYWFQS